MNYTKFLETVNETLERILPKGQNIIIRPVPKNNGIVLDGLSIQTDNSHVTPVVYLNPYYEQYLDGMTIQEICQDIKSLFEQDLPPFASEECLEDFEAMKSRVMMKLIHADSNEKLLLEIPHIPCLDLAIVFYLFLDRNPVGQMTALIHNDLLELWQTTPKKLFCLARQNTPKTYPAAIRSMSDVMKEIARLHIGKNYSEETLNQILDEEDDPSPLYVLSNQNGIYGACCILYQDLLKNFADSFGSDLIILPSSNHEVLLTPDEKGLSYDYLNSMVVQINHSEVPVEDQLSNHIYLYTRKDDQLHIVSRSDSLSGSPDFN